MKIECIKVGDFQTNCYILNKNGKKIIIDPGAEFLKIDQYINNDLVAILITHNHFDHVGALESLKEKYHVPVYKYDNLKDYLEIADFKFKTIHNPGHTIDLVGYLIDNHLFGGDFIFKNTIGRTDLPTGNNKDMKKSIENILKYPDDLIIYPGHDDITTLKDERINLENILKYL
ncbi:MAG: MBL fold metallo-hydrolase [Mollicutes bacterium]|nr:MBL fold metallo-hydrolase [Mollicutes bacterium]